MEDFGRLLSELRSRSHDTRLRAAKSLKEYVKFQQKELPPEEFNKFMGELNRREHLLPRPVLRHGHHGSFTHEIYI